MSVGSAIKADLFNEVNKSVVCGFQNHVNVPVLCRSGIFTDAVYPLLGIGLSEYLLIVNI
jgi:hypothetical protein